MGMVLTLIIVTDEAEQYDAIRAANQAAREHPCRVLAVIARKPKADSRLDAEIRVGESAPGRRSCCGCTARSGSTPTRSRPRCWFPTSRWSPGGRMRRRRTRRRTRWARSRSAGSPTRRPPTTPAAVLARLARAYAPGDTDFGWTRATPWRSVIAATLDQPHPGASPAADVAAEAGQPDRRPDRRLARPTGWGSRSPAPISAGPGITEVTFATVAGDVTLSRTDGRTATLSWPGRPDRSVALHRREIAELLAEELRRLDPGRGVRRDAAPPSARTPSAASWDGDLMKR